MGYLLKGEKSPVANMGEDFFSQKRGFLSKGGAPLRKKAFFNAP